MEELDDDLGDIQAAIKDREDALLRARAERVLEEEVCMRRPSNASPERQREMKCA